MAVTTIKQESLAKKRPDGTSFYVPRFEVKIADVGLPRDLLRDIVKIVYKDSLKELDSVTLTVNNWDAATNRFKYVGSETEQTLNDGSPQSKLYKLFEPCQQTVEVKMGYLEDLRTMLTGHFTSMAPIFDEKAPTLTVTCLNVLHSLRRKKYTEHWDNKKPSQVAQDLGQKRDGGKKRFELPIVINQNALNREVEVVRISQDNQYDIDFLLGLAREYGYVVYVEEKTAQHPKQLYFGPSEGNRPPQLRDVTFEFKWGVSMLEFKPVLTTANQYESVTVRGWHRGTRTCISETVTVKELGCNPDLMRLLSCGEPREQKVVDQPVFTRQQAKAKARAILLASYREMVTASVKVMGMPDIRSGQRVSIQGVGSRFGGTYFVTETTHTFDDNGYITEFSARRENECGAGA